MKTVVKKSLVQSKEFKSAARFIDKSKGKKVLRPALTYIEVDPQNKTITATNAHILIQIKTDLTEEYSTTTLLNIKGEQPDQHITFPAVSRIIPQDLDKYGKTIIKNIDVNDWLTGLDQLDTFATHQDQKTKRKNPIVTLKQPVAALQLFAENTDGNAKYLLNDQYHGENITITFNPHYMEAALKSFKDLKINNVTIYFNGPVSPIVIQGDNVTCLVLPIKTPTK